MTGPGITPGSRRGPAPDLDLSWSPLWVTKDTIMFGTDGERLHIPLLRQGS